MRFLNPEDAFRIIASTGQDYQPPQIVKLKEEIAGETRAAELRLSITGVVDEVHIMKIVKMKLTLDQLYIDWAEGKLA